MNLRSLFSSSTVFSIIMMASFLSVTQAAEKVVATVSSDDNQKTYKLVVDSKDERVIDHFYKDVYENGVKQDRKEILANALLGGGVVLEQRNKHVLMKLKSNDFNVEQGGMVIIDTLYSGVNGQRKSYEVQLAKGQSGWSLFLKGKIINEIQIKTNRVKVIGPVGIKSLVMK